MADHAVESGGRQAQADGAEFRDMQVTVELVGQETRAVEVEEGATYADLVAPLPVSVHQVSILVDGTHVPEDAPVEPAVNCVRVVRLVTGG